MSSFWRAIHFNDFSRFEGVSASRLSSAIWLSATSFCFGRPVPGSDENSGTVGAAIASVSGGVLSSRMRIVFRCDANGLLTAVAAQRLVTEGEGDRLVSRGRVEELALRIHGITMYTLPRADRLSVVDYVRIGHFSGILQLSLAVDAAGLFA